MSQGIIVSRANKALVIPRNGKTITLFPAAHAITHLNEDKLVIPHGHREFMLLKRIGYECPNPMFNYYDWAGGKPFSVQKATCASMTAYPRSYVLNDMGTGKTRAALWAWDYLHGNGLCGKLLVVAPLSTLNFVWAAEIFKTLPGRKCNVLHGSKKLRLERLNDLSADIYVINHDGLRTIEAELAKRTDIDVLVLDELAVYRNNSDRSKHMRKFAARFPWVWGMTGRPMPTEVTDVWAQCKIVTPERVPAFFKQAREMLMVKGFNNYQYFPKADAVTRAFDMMKPHVRYSLDDVVELPDMVIPPPRDIPLSAEQAALYKKMAREFQLLVKQQVITAVNAAAAMGKLLQISCGCIYTKAPVYVTVDSSPRQQELIDIIEGVEGKVIVFVPYRHALTELSKLLNQPQGHDAGPRVEHAMVHGDVTNRDLIFNDFQNTPRYKALLAHPACLAHGITLTAARTIVWYGPIASLDIFDQANARIRRVGQTEKQQVIRFQSTPVEKRFYKLLETRQDIQQELLKMFEDATGAVT